MKKLIILCFFLTGCAVPLERQFPEAPKELLTECPSELLLIQSGTKELSKVLDVIVDNYSLYHECRIRNHEWIEWYKKQRDNFNKALK